MNIQMWTSIFPWSLSKLTTNMYKWEKNVSIFRQLKTKYNKKLKSANLMQMQWLRLWLSKFKCNISRIAIFFINETSFELPNQ